VKTGVELSEALRSHPDRGWRQLVESYSRLVWSVALGMRLSEEDAGDVYQNTWVLLYRNASSIRDDRSLVAWITTTTRREAMLLIRRNQLRRDVEAIHNADCQGESGEDPQRAVEAEEEAGRLSRALAQLSERCQTILAKQYYSQEEPSYKKLASQLGIAIGSLGPTRLRCLKRLAQIMESLGA
jgi:RNA polymerase sigma factor (sigma-70 family)